MPLIVNRPPKKQAVPLCKWTWERDGQGYRLTSDLVLATLKPINDIGEIMLWRMAVKIGGRWYTGVREGLEQAFKAADGLIAKKSKITWVETNVHVVIEPWMGDLNFGVDKLSDDDILEGKVGNDEKRTEQSTGRQSVVAKAGSDSRLAANGLDRS